MPKTAYKMVGRKCCKCGNDKTHMGPNGKSYWFCNYDKNGYWDGKSYLCKNCRDNKGITPEMYEYFIDRKNNYFKGRMCCICKDDKTYMKNTGSPEWHTCECDKDNCTKWLCKSCYDTYHSNSNSNLRKRMTKVRMGMIEKDSSQSINIMSEAVVCKYLNIDNLNIKMDNFCYYVDANDRKYGKIDIKGSRLSHDGEWNFPKNRKIECDTYICIGFSINLDNIESAHIVPNEGWICNILSITITKDPLIKASKYDKFRVCDTNSLNVIYQDLLLFLKDKKLYGIDDIKKWLSRKDD